MGEAGRARAVVAAEVAGADLVDELLETALWPRPGRTGTFRETASPSLSVKSSRSPRGA